MLRSQALRWLCVPTFAVLAASTAFAQVKVAIMNTQAALLETANDAIMVRDLDHRIRYWNKGCERLYGWKAEDALGRRSPDLVDRDGPAFEAAFARFQKEPAKVIAPKCAVPLRWGTSPRSKKRFTICF